MKKLLVFSMLSMVLFSCSSNSKPIANYECKDYFTNSDWDLTYNKTEDTILYYTLDKNVSVKKDFQSATDSVKIKMSFDSEGFKKLPPQDTLRHKIWTSLLDSKYECKHIGTYRPYEVTINLLDNDSTLLIKVNFFASNAYGTPGELTSYYQFDSKTYKEKKRFTIDL